MIIISTWYLYGDVNRRVSRRDGQRQDPVKYSNTVLTKGGLNRNSESIYFVHKWKVFSFQVSINNLRTIITIRVKIHDKYVTVYIPSVGYSIHENNEGLMFPL